MSTIDYTLRLRRREDHELLASLIDLGIWCGVITSEQREAAMNLQRQAVSLLLQRKSLRPEEIAALQARWPEYVGTTAVAGESKPRKLSEDDLREIRRRLAAHESGRSIARAFGVSRTLIRYIRRAQEHGKGKP